ncbi:MAG: CBS domain-containing protein [Oscillospiraceae bacterium]|nr:CBS domain-containing protein [Oscillospiraceae bacterium]
MEVRDVMTGHVITVGQGESVNAAVALLKRYNLGALPVCDAAGRLRGMVTDRDIVLRCLGQGADPAATKISEIMSRGIVTADSGDSVASAAETMARDRVRRLPVTENGALVGMLSVCDLARHERCAAECGQALRAISANVIRY